MIIIDPSYEILSMHIDPAMIELAGRTCYKSEPKGDPEGFIRMLLKRGHESVLEHSMLSVRFITNRGVTHELVRHRLCAFSQESTRYVNYEGKGCAFIRPVWCDGHLLGKWDSTLRKNSPGQEELHNELSSTDFRWLTAMLNCEDTYMFLLSRGWRPEQAREVLPNSTKTEIVMTANAREWRHIFKLRTAPAAHPEMRRIMIPLLEELKESEAGVLFADINN